MKKIFLFCLIILLLCSACNRNEKEISSSLTVEESQSPQTDYAAAEEVKNNDANDWNPTKENTFLYLDWQGETNGLLERWIEAYRSGEYAQIYIDDPRDGLFQAWRLTCDGSDEYLIERRYAGADMSVELCGYSRIVTEGVIYYTFGEDLSEIDWLPLTVQKGLSEYGAVEEDDALWKQQAAISEEQAIELAVEVFDYNATYQIDERFVYLGQCFYGLKMFTGEDNHHGGNFAVSADGSVFWELGEGWHLIKDKSAEQVLSDSN